jgi:hypothetical protein
MSSAAAPICCGCCWAAWTSKPLSPTGRIVADSPTALAAVQTLLPAVPLWLPPLDDLARE